MSVGFEESRLGSHGQCLTAGFAPPPRVIVLLTQVHRAQRTCRQRIASMADSLSARAKSRRLVATAICHWRAREAATALLFTDNHLTAARMGDHYRCSSPVAPHQTSRPQIGVTSGGDGCKRRSLHHRLAVSWRRGTASTSRVIVTHNAAHCSTDEDERERVVRILQRTSELEARGSRLEHRERGRSGVAPSGRRVCGAQRLRQRAMLQRGTRRCRLAMSSKQRRTHGFDRMHLFNIVEINTLQDAEINQHTMHTLNQLFNRQHVDKASR